MNLNKLFLGSYIKEKEIGIVLFQGVFSKVEKLLMVKDLKNNLICVGFNSCEPISLFKNNILEKFGYENIDYGYSKQISLTKTIRLISSDGYMYPQIEEIGEMSHQEIQIVSLNRIQYIHELQMIELFLGHKTILQ